MSDRRFGPLPLEAMDATQRAVADEILAGPRASSTGLAGPFEAWLHSPGLAGTAQRVGEHVRFRSSIPTALNELAILLTARRWDAQFEFFAHRALAVDAGLAPEIADAVGRGERPTATDEGADADVAAVVVFATELLDTGDVTDEAFEAVVARWGKEGAADLIGAIGYYTLVSFTLNVDRYPTPDGSHPLS